MSEVRFEVSVGAKTKMDNGILWAEGSRVDVLAMTDDFDGFIFPDKACIMKDPVCSSESDGRFSLCRSDEPFPQQVPERIVLLGAELFPPNDCLSRDLQARCYQVQYFDKKVIYPPLSLDELRSVRSTMYPSLDVSEWKCGRGFPGGDYGERLWIRSNIFWTYKDMRQSRLDRMKCQSPKAAWLGSRYRVDYANGYQRYFSEFEVRALTQAEAAVSMAAPKVDIVAEGKRFVICDGCRSIIDKQTDICYQVKLDSTAHLALKALIQTVPPNQPMRAEDLIDSVSITVSDRHPPKWFRYGIKGPPGCPDFYSEVLPEFLINDSPYWYLDLDGRKPPN